MRIRWGTTRPTNPMPPVAATRGPTISAVASTSCRRTERSAKPRWCASRSPSSSAFMARHWRISHHDHSKVQGARNASNDQRAPARLPMLQNVRSRSCASEAMKVSRPITLPATVLMAMPASSRPATPCARRPST
ncbi:Uncharacterised protein [Bordetella pertussis]|nr:Uncharacterised protein [Bordetella pertussis]